MLFPLLLPDYVLCLSALARAICAKFASRVLAGRVYMPIEEKSSEHLTTLGI
jgi:hypothetical protein